MILGILKKILFVKHGTIVLKKFLWGNQIPLPLMRIFCKKKSRDEKIRDRLKKHNVL